MDASDPPKIAEDCAAIDPALRDSGPRRLRLSNAFISGAMYPA
jgi:hypothetical protein